MMSDRISPGKLWRILAAGALASASCGKKEPAAPAPPSPEITAPAREVNEQPPAPPEAEAPAKEKPAPAPPAAIKPAAGVPVIPEANRTRLLELAGSYAARTTKPLEALSAKARAWVDSASDAGEKQRRETAIRKVTALCETIAEVRSALDPGLVKVLHSDPEAIRRDVMGKLPALGLSAASLQDPALTPAKALNLAYEDLAAELRAAVRTENMPSSIFNAEYFDLLMERAIGLLISEKAGPGQ